MIELKNITVKFSKDKGDIAAVDNVSLSVEKGDIYGIVGYSGAGKSTLIRTINLLQRPNNGEVVIKGEDLMKLDEKELLKRRKKIGMIFQHFNLMRNITVYENVLFPIKHSGMSKADMKNKVDSLLERVGLQDYKNRYPAQLSGGQKQRVAIARALASDPEILLCDEATSALDPKTTLEILMLLKSLNKEFNLTIVLIAHQMEVIKEICDKVAFMENGVIVEQGDIVEVFGRTKSELGKNFIDSVNNMENVLDKLRENGVIDQIGEKGRLARLTYIGSTATEPLAVSLYEKFQVKTSILYGNLEYIGGTPIGNLIVILYGERDAMDKAIDYVNSVDTKIELLDVSEGKK